MSINPLLSVVEAATICGFNRSYIKAEINYQRLPATKNVTGGYEIAYDDLMRWLNSPIRGTTRDSLPNRLVYLIRQFYRADDFYNHNAKIRPLNVVIEAILEAAPLPSFQGEAEAETWEALFEVAYGCLFQFMKQIRLGKYGQFPSGSNDQSRQEAMRSFVRLFLDDWFFGACKRDVAMLRSKQMTVLKDACAVIFTEAQYNEWRKENRNIGAEGNPTNEQMSKDFYG